METSLKLHEHHYTQSLIPSPNSHSTTSSSCSSSPGNGLHANPPHPLPPPPQQQQLLSPKLNTRSDSANPYPTTFVQADTSSFKQVVQMLTGSPKPTISAVAAAAQSESSTKSHSYTIPPVKSIPKKNQSSGFKLYERRNSLKNLNINPLNPIFAPPSSGFSPRKPEILSPSILDFPALVLSPVTPLIPDPFDRSGAANFASCHRPLNNSGNSRMNRSCDLMDTDAEEKAIKEKGFFLHPSPASTPREAEPRLLPLFPVTSPRVSGSANPSS